MRPNSIHAVADRILRGADKTSVIKEFIDEFRYLISAGGDIGNMIRQEPELTGNHMADAYVAGLAECIALRSGMQVPPWVDAPPRFLADQVVIGGRHSRKSMLLKTPKCMSKRRLFCGEVTL